MQITGEAIGAASVIGALLTGLVLLVREQDAQRSRREAADTSMLPVFAPAALERCRLPRSTSGSCPDASGRAMPPSRRGSTLPRPLTPPDGRRAQ